MACYHGVSQNMVGLWVARIPSTQTKIGTFRTAQRAAEAVDAYARRLHAMDGGGWLALNFPDRKLTIADVNRHKVRPGGASRPTQGGVVRRVDSNQRPYFYAAITVDRKRIPVGSFRSRHIALRAVDAALVHHGRAPRNFPDEALLDYEPHRIERHNTKTKKTSTKVGVSLQRTKDKKYYVRIQTHGQRREERGFKSEEAAAAAYDAQRVHAGLTPKNIVS